MLKTIGAFLARGIIDRLAEDNQRLRRQLETAETRLETEVPALKDELRDARNQRNAAWAGMTTLRRERASHRMHIRALQKQLEASQVAVVGLRGKRADLEQAVGMLIHERDTARAELAEAKKPRPRRAPKKETA